MTELNTQAQSIELTDDQLELIAGGRSQIANVIFNCIPGIGLVNLTSEMTGGPTFGDLSDESPSDRKEEAKQFHERGFLVLYCPVTKITGSVDPGHHSGR